MILLMLACGQGPQAPVAAAPAPPLPTSAATMVYLEQSACVDCPLKASLEALPTVDRAWLKPNQVAFCISGSVDAPALTPILSDNALTLDRLEPLPSCPSYFRGVGPWDDHAEGRDVRIISRGEQIDLAAQLVPEHFTVLDFGATWCAPCHAASRELAPYLDLHDDVAVRAIDLESRDFTQAFALPVVTQLLPEPSGLPWFRAFSPAGEVIYEGADAKKLKAAVDAARG